MTGKQPVLLSALGLWQRTEVGAGGECMGCRKILPPGLTNYYVDASTGNDANPGTIGSPWATSIYAWKYICTQIDIGGQQVIINFADGVYDGISYFGDVTGVDGLIDAGYIPVGGGAITLRGQSSNTVLRANDASLGYCLYFQSLLSSQLFIDTFTLDINAPTGLAGIFISNSIVYVTNVTIINGDSNSVAVGCSANSVIFVNTIAVDTDAKTVLSIDRGSLMFLFGVVTSSIPITVNVYALCVFSGILSALVQPTGTVTGKRYQADGLSLIETSGGGPNYLPGTIAGTVSGGSVYE